MMIIKLWESNQHESWMEVHAGKTRTEWILMLDISLHEPESGLTTVAFLYCYFKKIFFFNYTNIQAIQYNKKQNKDYRQRQKCTDNEHKMCNEPREERDFQSAN